MDCYLFSLNIDKVLQCGGLQYVIYRFLYQAPDIMSATLVDMWT